MKVTSKVIRRIYSFDSIVYFMSTKIKDMSKIELIPGTGRDWVMLRIAVESSAIAPAELTASDIFWSVEVLRAAMGALIKDIGATNEISIKTDVLYMTPREPLFQDNESYQVTLEAEKDILTGEITPTKTFEVTSENLYNMIRWVEKTLPLYKACWVNERDITGEKWMELVSYEEKDAIETLLENSRNVLVFVPAVTSSGELKRTQYAVLDKDSFNYNAQNESSRYGCNQVDTFRGIDKSVMYIDLQKFGMSYNYLVPSHELRDMLSAKERIFALMPSYMTFASLASRELTDNPGEVSSVSRLHCQNMDRKFSTSFLVPCKSDFTKTGDTCKTTDHIYRQPWTSGSCPAEMILDDRCCYTKLDDSGLHKKLFVTLMRTCKYKKRELPPKFSFLIPIYEWYSSVQSTPIDEEWFMPIRQPRWEAEELILATDPGIMKIHFQDEHRVVGDFFSRVSVFNLKRFHSVNIATKSPVPPADLVGFLVKDLPRLSMSMNVRSQPRGRDLSLIVDRLFDTEHFSCKLHFVGDEDWTDPTPFLAAKGYKSVHRVVSDDGDNVWEKLVKEHCSVIISTTGVSMDFICKTALKYIL